MARLLALLLHAVGVWPVGGANPCWSGDFSFASCCLVNSAQCWGGGFTYERCCLQSPLLSAPEVEAVRKMKSQALNCGCGKPDLSHPAFKGGRFTWCKFYQSIMLNQDLRPFYMPFLELSVEQLAECPLGSLAMVLMDTSLKVANAKGAPPKLTEMPSFLRAREMLQMILGMGLSLVDVTTSGWMLFNQVSALRGILLRRGGLEAPSEGAAACLQTPATETLPGRMLQTMMDGANFVPVGTKALLQLLQAPPPGPACRVTVPAMQMLVSYGLLQHTAPEPQQTHVPGAPLDSKEEGEVLLRSAEVQLRTALLEDSGSLKVLGLMLLSPWPIPEVLDLLSMPGRVNLTVQEAMLELLNLTQGHPLWDAAVANPVSGRYSFRVNPYREMVSDMVRYTRLPFCGLRPFMRMVASIAQAAVEAGCPKKGVYLEDLSLCEFTFIEGGPHLGDCALWAASALRLVGVRVRAIAYEPLPDAAGLFQQSVLENGFGGAVEVKMAALGAQRGPVEMIHFRGHNGQATVNGQDFPSHDPREVVKVPTEELALDEEIPANWPRIDTLKLSANGAERNILAGAQRLLKNGRICSVLMHARKAKRGRRPILEDPAPGNVSRYAYELMMWLEEGNMDIYEHNDALTGKGRGRVQRLTTPKEMDEIFDDPELTEQIYFLAISRHRHCASAQRHFHSALDRPAGAPLEVPGFWD